MHDLVLLDVRHPRIAGDRGRRGGRHARGEALERVAVDKADPGRVSRCEPACGPGHGRALHGARLEDDDVRARGRALGGATLGCDRGPGEGQEREQHGKGSHCSLLGLTTRQVKASGGAMSSVSVEIVLAAGRRLHRGLPDEDRRLGLLLAPDRRFSETASPRLA